jgi:hypothetical protein
VVLSSMRRGICVMDSPESQHRCLGNAHGSVCHRWNNSLRSIPSSPDLQRHAKFEEKI